MNNTLKGACIIGQSGGPTAVINASAYGVIKTALDSKDITRVLGAANGIRGVLADRLYDMGQEDPYELSLLMNTPSSELGSVRHKMADPDVDDSEYARILEIFQKYNVRYFFYNGGNDSMDTCEKVSRYMARAGWECRIMGVPKTIDNDLALTDHCPGFGSAAKYIATTCMEVSKDARVYDTGMITVLELMGRHAGWLTGAAALATAFGAGPDLIYLPETVFDMDRFLEDVTAIYDKTKKCLIAVSEGIHYADGAFVAEAETSANDGFGHAQLGGLAAQLAAVIKERTGAKVRGIELSLLQRCAAHLASEADVKEAYLAGEMAVKSALAGETGKMVAFECERGEPPKSNYQRKIGPLTVSLEIQKGEAYKCKTKLIPLDAVANLEKKVPLEWINAEHNGVTQEFIDYVLPLVQGEPERPTENSLPRYARLKKVLTTEMDGGAK